MFLASLVQQSSSRTVLSKSPYKMKLLLGLSLIVLIIQRMVLIPANLHLLDLLIDSSHFTLTGSVTRRAIEHIFTLIGYFAEDPVAKDIATKSARLAYQVTSDKHLFASARAVVDQLITLLHKDKLRAVQDLVLAVDKHLTGNTIPPIVLDNVGMLGMPGKGGAGVMPGGMGNV
uniref:Uncharacterized protein n=1 Tax=Cacopsylla melanoneura TaxID=428564 RepID=A0A8D8RHM0_9HEMI